ncbi:MAG TPA: hypothetical protein VE994_12410 [Terriglobales bacterium]|nr:hypothetical protein [Terriglobales bacterium]
MAVYCWLPPSLTAAVLGLIWMEVSDGDDEWEPDPQPKDSESSAASNRYEIIRGYRPEKAAL